MVHCIVLNLNPSERPCHIYISASHSVEAEVPFSNFTDMLQFPGPISSLPTATTACLVISI